MSKKLRKKINLALHHLRQARNLLGHVSLADGLPVFDQARVAHQLNQQAIAATEKLCLTHPSAPAGV